MTSWWKQTDVRGHRSHVTCQRSHHRSHVRGHMPLRYHHGDRQLQRELWPAGRLIRWWRFWRLHTAERSDPTGWDESSWSPAARTVGKGQRSAQPCRSHHRTPTAERQETASSLTDVLRWTDMTVVLRRTDWFKVDVSDPAEDYGGAVQDAALWHHLQAAAVVTSHKLRPVHLREKHQNITSGVTIRVSRTGTNQKPHQSTPSSGSDD